ncbi:hypothetical protein SAMN02745181_0270 [Rubritalea squalenifaciens DSM 18772]|uniref:Lipoprotein n=2 Tax=Rubritalea squalenifaciens TaxID=407226 RepID=A0A1M6BNI3_9BACT|nr:hypothetical protein SAMN02745181_0270 [Rubritalea squalenifaciens DSM 18772]
MSFSKKTMIRTLISVCAALFIVGCDSKQPEAAGTEPSPEAMQTELQAGGVYASKNEEGKFTITKILALDEFTVHARFYNEEFDQIPSDIATKNLSFLIGHAPIAREGFLKDNQQWITTEEVSADELKGYKLYLEAMREQ